MRPTLFLLLAAAPLAAEPFEPAVLARLGDARFRLDAPATVLTYAPDGKQLATWDGSAVVLWAADGRRGLAVRLDAAAVHALRFTADGKGLFAVAYTEDRTRLIRIDPAAGTVVSDRVLAPGRWVATFAPNGARVALYGRWGDDLDQKTKVPRGLWCFSTADGKELWADPKPVAFRTVVFRPDGGAVLASDAGGPVREYDAATGAVGPDFQVEDLYTTGLAYSPDGKRVYGSSVLPWDGRLFCWDVGAHRSRWVVPLRDVVVVGLLEGGGIVGLEIEKNVARWHRRDPETGKPLGDPVRLGAKPQSGFAFHPDGKTAAVAADYHFRRWDLTTGKPVTPPVEPAGTVTHLHLAAGGAKVRGWYDGWYEWDVKTGAQARLVDPAGVLRGQPVAAAPDGRWVAQVVGAGEGTPKLEVVEPATGRVQRLGPWVTGECVFVPGRRLVIHGLEQFTVYDPDAGRVVTEVRLPFTTNLRTVASDGSALLALRHGEDTVRGVRWDLRTGRQTADWTVTDAPLAAGLEVSESAALAPGGESFVCWRIDRSIPFFLSGASCRVDAGTGRLMAEWPDPIPEGGGLQDILNQDFRPDGRSLLEFPGTGRGFRLREVATGGVRGAVRFPQVVNGWGWTPDGRSLLVATHTYPVEIWSAVARGGNWGAKAEAELWTALADPDAAKAYAAIRHVLAHPAEAAAFLKARVKLPEAPPAEWVAERLRGLDAKAFRDRERATADFLKAGEAVLPALRAARPTASPEARERIDKVLAAFPKSPARLQAIRVCEVAEGLGTPAAIDLLKGWAADAATTLGREARASVERIGRR